ncbi:MAG TPA: AraC family transcriptional regulator [Ignavibacteria bacterium]|nr:AraC family transcriptional regulator [Ignavibacteria bacterium]
MIVEYKTIELFGKMLFEKVILIPPFKKKNPMPNEACFLYIMDGEYNSISEKEQLRIKADEAVLMKCGSYLSQMYTSKTSKRYEAVAVHFYPDILKKVYDNKLPNFLKTEKGNSELTGMGKINSDLLISKYIESILLYFENPSLVDEEILILKLKEIILLLNQTKNAPVIHSILSNLFNPTTYSFREIIDAHIYSTISLSELSELTNMSLSTFKREFKKIYNNSPAVYIKDKKLTKAKELLSVSKLRVSDVTFDSGFNNVAHFSKSFKQKFGITPSNYQLTHLNKPLS